MEAGYDYEWTVQGSSGGDGAVLYPGGDVVVSIWMYTCAKIRSAVYLPHHKNQFYC